MNNEKSPSRQILPAKYAECTPGPWAIRRGGGHAYNSIEGSDIIHTNGREHGQYGSSKSYTERVCENLGDLELPGPQANALLISDAPRLAAAVVELRDKLTRVLEHIDGTTTYSNEDDEIGNRACCGALSYRPHNDDCYVLDGRLALEASKEWAV